MRARHLLLSSFGAATLLAAAGSGARAEPFLIVGNDEKVSWDAKGDTVLALPERIRC